MPDPTFTLEHEEQTWRVELPGEKYAVYLTRYGTGCITVTPFVNKGDGQFRFRQSDPNVVVAIGRLLMAAARKGGATDA